jgi:hypothetical protein
MGENFVSHTLGVFENRELRRIFGLSGKKYKET